MNEFLSRWREPILSSHLVLLVDHTGLGAPQLDSLRKDVRRAGGGVVVVRNDLATELAQGTHLVRLVPYLRGPNLLVLASVEAWRSVGEALLGALARFSGQRRVPFRMRIAWLDGALLQEGRFRALVNGEDPAAPWLLHEPVVAGEPWYQGPETYILKASAAEMETLRSLLRAALAVPERDGSWEGWRWWFIDANVLLAHTPGIRLRPGFRLQAVAERDSHSGRGVVWAWPPGTTPVELRSRTEPPAGALPCATAFTTDGSARALLEGAVLLRELDEVGAFWHSASWSTHHIVDCLPDEPWVPCRVPLRGGAGSSVQRMPEELCPRVQRGRHGMAQVVFFTFTSYVTVRLVGYLDSRTSGREAMPEATEEVTFATAGHGGIP